MSEESPNMQISPHVVGGGRTFFTTNCQVSVLTMPLPSFYDLIGYFGLSVPQIEMGNNVNLQGVVRIK